MSKNACRVSRRVVRDVKTFAEKGRHLSPSRMTSWSTGVGKLKEALSRWNISCVICRLFSLGFFCLVDLLLSSLFLCAISEKHS
jgi:hypothetical protein